MKFLKSILMVVMISITLLIIKDGVYAEDRESNIDGGHGATESRVDYFPISDNDQGMLIYFVDYNGTMLDNASILIEQPSLLWDNRKPSEVLGLTSSNFYNYVYPRYTPDRKMVRYEQMDLGSFNSRFGTSMKFAHTDDNSNFGEIRSALMANNVFEDILNYSVFANTQNRFNKWKTTNKDEDSIFLIIEPIYSFRTPLNKTVSAKPTKEHSARWIGTVPGYAAAMTQACIIKDTRYATIARANQTGEDGIREHGYWWNATYSNMYQATFVCTNRSQPSLGIDKAGSSMYGKYLSYSEMMDKSNGLGIGIFWIGHDTEDDPNEPNNPNNPNNPPLPTVNKTTYTYPGTAKPEVYTYNDALPNYNLDKTLNPEGRMPSSKRLKNGIYFDEWFCSYTTNHVDLSTDVTVRYQVQTGHWSRWTTNSERVRRKDYSMSSYNRGFNDSTDFYQSRFVSVTDGGKETDNNGTDVYYYNVTYQTRAYYWDAAEPYYVKVTRKSSYEKVEDYDVYAFEKATITNPCFNKNQDYEENRSVGYTIRQYANNIVHTPTNTSVNSPIQSRTSLADAKNIANQRAPRDADNWQVKSDYLNVGGTIFFDDTQGIVGVNAKRIATVDFPSTTKEHEGVLVPFNTKNGKYNTSGTYYYRFVEGCDENMLRVKISYPKG